MIAIYYQDIYLVIVLLLTIFQCSQYNQSILSNSNRARTSNVLFAVIVALFMTLFIGFRPCHIVFFDMMVYDQQYAELLNKQFFFDWDTNNKFFDNWMPYMASIGVPSQTMFLIYSLIYFGGILLACRRLFPNDTLLALLFYLGAFSTFSYGVNGIRAGMAASLFLIALSYTNKLWLSVPLAIFTFGMHHSMSLVIVPFIFILFIKNPRYYFIVWVVSFLIAALHITYFQHLFASFTDEHGASYLLSNEHSGFRIDFIIYSVLPILIGFIFICKKNFQSETYNTLLSLYTLVNSMWLLCMYSSFTNRISYLSWFMYPIVLLYPFVNFKWSNKQSQYLKFVVYGHIGFTIFMHFVYYN